MYPGDKPCGCLGIFFYHPSGVLRGCGIHRHMSYTVLLRHYSVSCTGQKEQGAKQKAFAIEVFKFSPAPRPFIRPVTMETGCCLKKFELQRYPPKDLCTARYEHKSWGEKFQTILKNEKKHSWADLGAKTGPKKTQPSVNSKRRDSESWTDIDRDHQRLRQKSERGALVRGSDPPSGHSVHTTAGDTWRAPARRLIQNTFGRCCVKNRRQKILDPSPMAKNRPFFRFARRA